jgi:hypothetical protein
VRPPSEELAARVLTIVKAEEELRVIAEKYGFDPDTAVERARKLSRETGLGILAAVQRVRFALGEEWMGG